MTRCAAATLESFKKAINNLPDDCAICTNLVGNLSIYKRSDDGYYVLLGYIGLRSLELEGAFEFECEFTPTTNVENGES